MSRPGQRARSTPPRGPRRGAPGAAGAVVPRLALTLVDLPAAPDLPVRATLRRWAGLALERDAELALVFVDTRKGRRLNREFRGRDYATNVLTFGYEAAPRVRADIVLCLPVVRREARAQGKTLRQHLAHLVVHGVLHAQGYDHERDSQARVMQALERDALARLRIPDPYSEG